MESHASANQAISGPVASAPKITPNIRMSRMISMRRFLPVALEPDPAYTAGLPASAGNPAASGYSLYSGQNGAEASYADDVSCRTARSASIRPFPKHSS